MKVPLNSLLSARIRHLVQRVAAIVERCLVCLHESPLCVQDKNMLGKEIYELAKLPLILPQLFFCLLAVFYIRAGPVPPDNFSGFIAKRHHWSKKPAVDSLMAANPRFFVAGFPCDQQRPPSFYEWSDVFHMDG